MVNDLVLEQWDIMAIMSSSNIFDIFTKGFSSRVISVIVITDAHRSGPSRTEIDFSGSVRTVGLQTSKNMDRRSTRTETKRSGPYAFWSQSRPLDRKIWVFSAFDPLSRLFFLKLSNFISVPTLLAP